MGLDIMGRQTETTLREHAELMERLEGISASIPGCLYTLRLSPDGRYSLQYASPAITDLIGNDARHPAENAGMILATIPEEDLTRIRETLARSSVMLEQWQCEWRVTHPHKGEIMLEARAQPRREPDGSTLWHGFVQDISGRNLPKKNLESGKPGHEELAAAHVSACGMVLIKPSGLGVDARNDSSVLDDPRCTAQPNIREPAQKERKGLFCPIFDQAPIGVALLNPQTGTFVRVNRTYCEIIGYDVEDIEGKNFRAITHPEDLQAGVDNLALVGAGKIPGYAREKRYIKSDGDIAWVNLTVSALCGKAEEPGLALAIVEDITIRKRAEERVALNLHLSEIARNGDLNDLIQTALNAITRLTDSRIGHLHLTAVHQENGPKIPSPESCIARKTGSADSWKECFIAHGPQSLETFPGRDRHDACTRKADTPRDIMVRIIHDSTTGAIISVHNKPTAYRDHDTQTIQETGSLLIDLVARKKAENTQKATIRLLRLCNDAETSDTFILTLSGFFKQLVGCDMVRARLPLFKKRMKKSEPSPKYESSAFIPLQFNEGKLGLFEFGDRRKGFFTAEMLALLESLVSYSAIALAKLLADESLVETERALRSAKQIARLGSFVFDIQNNTWSSSAILNSIFGIEADKEHSLAAWFDLIHPSQRKEMIEYTEDLLKHKKQRFDKEYLVLRASDRKEIWVHGLGEIEYDTGGSPLRLFVTIQDITERRLAQKAIYKVTQRLLTVEEDLRKKIAGELHDNIGQELTALNLNFSFISKHIGRTQGAYIYEKLEDCNTLIIKVNRSVRQLMTELRPPQLDDYGLTAAITWYARQFSDRTNISVHVCNTDFPRLSEEKEVALFRIFQEYFANIAKYPDVTTLDICLKKESDGIMLSLGDNRTGMRAPASPEEDWGIMIMRERAELIGGTLKLDSTPSGGTVVIIRITEKRLWP